jgi:hypothetical protein
MESGVDVYNVGRLLLTMKCSALLVLRRLVITPSRGRLNDALSPPRIAASSLPPSHHRATPGPSMHASIADFIVSRNNDASRQRWHLTSGSETKGRLWAVASRELRGPTIQRLEWNIDCWRLKSGKLHAIRCRRNVLSKAKFYATDHSAYLFEACWIVERLT